MYSYKKVNYLSITFGAMVHSDYQTPTFFHFFDLIVRTKQKVIKSDNSFHPSKFLPNVCILSFTSRPYKVPDTIGFGFIDHLRSKFSANKTFLLVNLRIKVWKYSLFSTVVTIDFVNLYRGKTWYTHPHRTRATGIRTTFILIA